jgi:hypothetical protein
VCIDSFRFHNPNYSQPNLSRPEKKFEIPFSRSLCTTNRENFRSPRIFRRRRTLKPAEGGKYSNQQSDISNQQFARGPKSPKNSISTI